VHSPHLQAEVGGGGLGEAHVCVEVRLAEQLQQLLAQPELRHQQVGHVDACPVNVHLNRRWLQLRLDCRGRCSGFCIFRWLRQRSAVFASRLLKRQTVGLGLLAVPGRVLQDPVPDLGVLPRAQRQHLDAPPRHHHRLPQSQDEVGRLQTRRPQDSQPARHSRCAGKAAARTMHTMRLELSGPLSRKRLAFSIQAL
jgi:hypothetical protein